MTLLVGLLLLLFVIACFYNPGLLVLTIVVVAACYAIYGVGWLLRHGVALLFSAEFWSDLQAQTKKERAEWAAKDAEPYRPWWPDEN